MYVNAFWFGFLMAIVAMIVLSIILAIIKSKHEEKFWEEVSPPSPEEIVGKKFQIYERDGFLYGEEIEDNDDVSEDH